MAIKKPPVKAVTVAKPAVAPAVATKPPAQKQALNQMAKPGQKAPAAKTPAAPAKAAAGKPAPPKAPQTPQQQRAAAATANAAQYPSFKDALKALHPNAVAQYTGDGSGLNAAEMARLRKQFPNLAKAYGLNVPKGALPPLSPVGPAATETGGVAEDDGGGGGMFEAGQEFTVQDSSGFSSDALARMLAGAQGGYEPPELASRKVLKAEGAMPDVRDIDVASTPLEGILNGSYVGRMKWR
jgi:hypothetical protein